MNAGGEGRASGERPGTRLLGLLAPPLTRAVLRELCHGPRRASFLRQETGASKQEVSACLEQLVDLDAAICCRHSVLPGRREYTVTRAGLELRFVARTLEGWLTKARLTPLDPNGEEALESIAALREAWDSTGLHALAFEVAAGERDAELSAWLRRGAAPLCVATRWERRHMPRRTPAPTPLDGEAALLLIMPLLRPPRAVSGACRLAIEFPPPADRPLAGVTVEVDDGKLISCEPGIAAPADATLSGDALSWLRAAIEAKPERLRLTGKRRLAEAMVHAINLALFSPRWLGD